MVDANNSIEHNFCVEKTDALLELLPKYNCHLTRKSQSMAMFLKENYKNYIQDLQASVNFTDNPSLGMELCQRVESSIDEIAQNACKIVEIFDLFNRGKMVDASMEAFKLLDFMKQYFLHRVTHIYDGLEYYRIRKYEYKDGKEPFQLVRKELFHIPYRKNYLVGPERYSLPGHPCLYLASQPELAWYECGKPEKFAISRYSVPKSEEKCLQFIDFSEALIPMKTNFICWLHNEDDKQAVLDYLFKYIYIYPLRAACSVPVEHPEGSFKEEYIMPQMLMQWICSRGGFDGIRYESCLDDDSVHCMCGHNNVLMTNEFDDDGFDTYLRKNLKMGSPVLIETNAVPYNETTKRCDGPGNDKDPFHWNLGSVPRDIKEF